MSILGLILLSYITPSKIDIMIKEEKKRENVVNSNPSFNKNKQTNNKRPSKQITSTSLIINIFYVGF